MARNFNGTSDFIEWLALPSGDTSALINLGCWFKTSASTGGLLCSDDGNTHRVTQFKVNATKMQWFLSTGGTLHTLNGSVVVNDGKWHHAAGSYDGTTMRLYVDGVLDGTLTTGATSTLAGRRLRAGAQIPGVTAQFLNGSMAEVFIRYSAITAGEAKALAAGLPASHLAPAHYWPLWGADSPEPDIGIGTHVTGSLTGTSAASGGRAGRRLLTLA